MYVTTTWHFNCRNAFGKKLTKKCFCIFSFDKTNDGDSGMKWKKFWIKLNSWLYFFLLCLTSVFLFFRKFAEFCFCLFIYLSVCLFVFLPVLSVSSLFFCLSVILFWVVDANFVWQWKVFRDFAKARMRECTIHFLFASSVRFSNERKSWSLSINKQKIYQDQNKSNRFLATFLIWKLLCNLDFFENAQPNETDLMKLT